MSVDAIKSACAPAPESSCKPTPASGGAVETVSLRRATAADAAALALVGAATFLEAFTWMLPGADIVAHCAQHHTPAAYAKYLQDPATRIMLAVVGADAPVGYAMLCEPEFPSFDVLPGDIELKRIYLFSRFRGAPVVPMGTRKLLGEDAATETSAASAPPPLRPAQAMMDQVVADALELRRTRLLLGTHSGNLRAIAFYRRNGFVEAGTRTFQVGRQSCCDLIFAKQL